MANLKYFLRFVNALPRIIGTSKYRPSEGWFDVTSIVFQNSAGATGSVARIDRPAASGTAGLEVVNDKAITHVYFAAQRGDTIPLTVVDVVDDGVVKTRWEMDSVVVTNFGTTSHHLGDEVCHSVVLEYQKLKTTVFGDRTSKRA